MHGTAVRDQSVRVGFNHWPELPQVLFLSRQNTSCRTTNKHEINTTNIFRDKHFVAPFFILFFIFCRDKHNFVATNVLPRQAYFCRDKRLILPATNTCLSRQMIGFSVKQGATTIHKNGAASTASTSSLTMEVEAASHALSR